MNTNIHQINVPFKNSMGTVSSLIGALFLSAGCVRSQHMLVALLGGILLLGVSPAFAEGPELSDQEVLQAWGQSQMEVQPNSQPSTRKRTQGPQLLTEEELDRVNAGGFADYTSVRNSTIFMRPLGLAPAKIDEPGPMMPMKPKPMPTT